MARIRTRTLNMPQVIVSWKSTVLPPYSSQSLSTPSIYQGTLGSLSCSDTTGPKPYVDHPLDIRRKVFKPCLVRGVSKSLYMNALGHPARHEIDSWACAQASRFDNWTGNSSLVEPTVNDWNYYSTKALSNLNPSVPKTDIPVFIFEFKDFPGMLHDLGRVLARKVRPSDVPGGYLAYRFGWAPLFQDLQNLLNFADLVKAQRNSLLRMMNEGGERIARRLGSHTLSTSSFPDGSFTLGPIGSGAEPPVSKVSWRWVGSEHAWYTARRRLKRPALYYDLKDLDTAAFRSVFGLNLSAASIWEALPWSWLVDYFINVGDVLDASRGYIDFDVQNFNVMIRRNYRAEFSLDYLEPGMVYQQGSAKLEYKGRRQPSHQPILAFRPFLTDGMKNILAALVTSRGLRKYGH